MLTDVFVTRYEGRQIWTSYGDRERRFMVQASKMITEQLFPYSVGGKVNEAAKSALKLIHDKLAMEIGSDALLPFSVRTLERSISDKIKDYLRMDFKFEMNADLFIKERLSLVEIAFRDYQKQVEASNDDLPRKLALIPPNNHVIGGIAYGLANLSRVTYESANQHLNTTFNQNVTELNERFRQANLPLRYHNGYIQISEDSMIAENVEAPFWSAIADFKWKNVAHDMLEAIDRRDNGRKHAALSAAMALESAIKIISDDRGWTTGNEKGAASYIDNLVSEKNGRFIDVWESNILKNFFSEVRNKLGHGAGSARMLELSEQQDSWAIQTCMSWIKSLIGRI